MSATVTWSLEGSPPCSWESLLEESSTSLKNLIPILSHWSDHLSCSNQCVSLLSSPSCSSWGVAFFLSCWSMSHYLLVVQVAETVSQRFTHAIKIMIFKEPSFLASLMRFRN